MGACLVRLPVAKAVGAYIHPDIPFQIPGSPGVQNTVAVHIIISAALFQPRLNLAIRNIIL